MSDRKRAIETLKQLRLDYEEFYEEYNNEVTQAYDMAISSLETDEAYDLMYEQPEFCKDCISRAQAQTEMEMNASRYTIAKERCGMGQVEWSDQLIKVSDAVNIIRELPSVTPQVSSGFDKNSKKTRNVSPIIDWNNCHTSEQLDSIATAKNNLGVDVVSRKAVLNTLDMDSALDDEDRTVETYKELLKECYKVLPSVTPQEPRWISVSEGLPKEHICDDGYHEPSKSVLVQMKSGAMHTARYWSRYDERWLDLNYPTTDEVIAWMSLPTPYREEEE